eukprot:TRINITY_DN10214_c0_g1_i1.p1 TRINITY_DN10214_c0_g1~~TRINITY_DN10214_c0_g1_i1.p1  ORF type:complete len:136 (+),score=1.61 TRINITY_DN10214_c0_g1_i1:41-409(+)
MSQKQDVNYIKLLTKVQILSELPSYCDIIWSYFKQNQKSILLLDAVESHLLKSNPDHKASHINDIKKSMNELFNLVPEWCSIKTVSGSVYLSATMDTDIFLKAKAKIEASLEETRKHLTDLS